MSYPTRRQFALSTQASLSATANVFNLSQAAQAGNLLVACLAGDKNTGPIGVTDNTGSGTWNLTSSNSVVITGNSVSLYIAWKVAVGGETQVTMTTTTSPSTGNTGYMEEMVDDGTGAWQLVAKAQPAYSDTARTSAASGTTDTADYDGRALAVGVIDSQMSYTGSFSNGFTLINTPVSPSGSGGGNAGCWVATKDIPAGTTTNTTYSSTGSDQLTCAIAVFGKVESAGPPPTANAGADQSVVTGTRVQRTGTSTGTTATSYSWALSATRPAGVANYTSASAAFDYTPTVAGTYEFVLTANSANGPGTDSFVLTVTSAPTAPTITAIPNATITLPNSYSYTAEDFDNGSAITSRSWVIQSGTGAGTVLSTTAAVSWTPPADGTYTLRYSATNGIGTTTDDVTVTVNPAPVVPPATVVNISATAGKNHYAVDIAEDGASSRSLYYPSQLATLSFDPEFKTVDGWVQASPRADAPTTSANTLNAREEARETLQGNTTNGSAAHMAFDPRDGQTRWQRTRTRIMGHPLANNVGVSVFQLHSGADDMMMVRTRYNATEGKNKLVLRVYDPATDNAKDVLTLDPDYQFGREFDLMIVIRNSMVYFYYNDFTVPAYAPFNVNIFPAVTTFMFKWGTYNQFYANRTGATPETTPGVVATDRGTAHYRNLSHWHQGWTTPENYFNIPVVSGVPATSSIDYGSAFSATATASNSPTEYKWTIVDGPASVGAVISSLASVSWTPTTAGTYTVGVWAKNAQGWSNPTYSTVTAAGPQPAFLRGSTSDVVNTQAASFAITLPTRSVGDALVVAVSNDEVRNSTTLENIENFVNPDTASANRGWTVLATEEQGTSTNHRVTILYKASAQGGTADDLTVTQVDPEEATWVAVSVGNPGPKPPDIAMDEGGLTSEVKGVPRTGLSPARWFGLVFLGTDSSSTQTLDPVMDASDPGSATWTRFAAVNPPAGQTSSAATFAWHKTYPEGTTETSPASIGAPTTGGTATTVNEQWIRFSLLFQGTYPDFQVHPISGSAVASAEVPETPDIGKVRLVASRPVSTGHLTAVALRSTYRTRVSAVAAAEVTQAALVVRALKLIAGSAQFAGVMRTASGDVDVTTRLYTTRPPIEAVVAKAKVTRVTLADNQRAEAIAVSPSMLTKVLYELDYSLLAESVTTGRISTMKEMVAEKPIWTSGVVRNARINDPFTWKGLAEAFAVAEILQVRSLKSHAIVSGVTDDTTSQIRVRRYNDQLAVIEAVTDSDVIRIGYLDTAELSVVESVLAPRSLYVVPDFGIQTLDAESVAEPATIIRGIPYSVRAIAEGKTQVDNPLFVASLRSRAISNGEVPQRKLTRVTLHDDRAVAEGAAFYGKDLLSRVRNLPHSLITAEGLVEPTVESIRVTPFVNQALLSEVESSAPFLAVVTGLWQAIYADSIVLYGSQRVIITTAVGRSVTDTSVATMRIIRGRAYAEAVVAEADLVNLGIKQFLYVDVEIPQANLLTLKQYSEHLVGDGLARTDLHRTGYISSIVAIIDLNGDVIRGELPTEPRVLAAPKPPAEETHVIKFTRPFGVLRT